MKLARENIWESTYGSAFASEHMRMRLCGLPWDENAFRDCHEYAKKVANLATMAVRDDIEFHCTLEVKP